MPQWFRTQTVTQPHVTKPESEERKIERQTERAARRLLRVQQRIEQRNDYNQYMKSEEWQTLRRKVFARAKGICEGCGEAAATAVHHLTYERMGEEMLFDLVAVCQGCHDKIHERVRTIAVM